jgi:hypothetical protein
VLWDMARAPHSFLSLGYTRNNPGRLIRSDEVLPRLEAWTHWLGFFAGSGWLNVALLAAGSGWLAHGVFRERSRRVTIDWQIAGFGLAFLGWLWLVAFNTYDRYLHTLAPFVLLLAARALVGIWRALGARRGALALIVALIVIGMAPPVNKTLHGSAAIGGDQGNHTGIDQLADFLNATLPGETVYDHWLGWELVYYLGSSPHVIVIYSAWSESLAHDMVNQTHPCYFVAPSPQHAAPWLDILQRTGMAISIVYRDSVNQFVVYRLEVSPRFSSG